MNHRKKFSLGLFAIVALVTALWAAVMPHVNDWHEALSWFGCAPDQLFGGGAAVGMMLFQRKTLFTPAQFSLASAGVLGTQQKFALDRTWPIEEILIHVDVTAGATGPTPLTGSNGVSGLDALLGIVKRVNLSVNDGIQPRSIVDFSGVGLLEYAVKTGINLDSATLEAIRLWQAQAAYANNLKFRYTIRVPLVHPLLAEPLRTRCLLPVHTHPQDPVLTLDFESSANMVSAGSLAAVQVSVDLIRRQMSQATTDEIRKLPGGFLPFDLIETPFAVATGVSGEQRFAIPSPGSYLNLLFRQYLGGATVARDVLDQTTTFGQETKWRLETGGVVLRDWRWKNLQVQNEYSQVKPGITTTFADIGGAIASGTSFRPASSTLLDFLTDNLDSAAELGSVLDTNLPATTGLKMEVIGSVASVATNASVMYIGGHRLYGKIDQFQAVKV